MDWRNVQKRLHQVGRQYTLAAEITSPSLPMRYGSDGQPKGQDLAEKLGFHSLWDLSSPDSGAAVTASNSSWVRRVQSNGIDYFVKTYDYPTIRSRLRGTLRNTGPLRPSRSQREAAALQWFRLHNFPTPAFTGFAEVRRLGWLKRAVLVTQRFPGRDLAALLPSESPSNRDAIGACIGTFVQRMHDLGFRDRNLDLRNLLLADDRSSLAIAKIDSPRHRLVRTGEPNDRLARADWTRLLPQLDAFGIAAVALRAAGLAT
jgi:hypothetical protein